MKDPIQTVHDYAAAINALDADRFASLFAPAAEIHDPVGARRFLSQFTPLLDSGYLRGGKIQVSGNQAAFPWAMEATEKNGRTAAADGIDVVVFAADVRMEKACGYWDPSAFVALRMAERS
jgi:hypothetical protein